MKIRELRTKLKNMENAELIEVLVQMYKVLPKAVVEEKLIDDIIGNRSEYLETRRREREAEKEYREAYREENVSSIAATQKWKALPDYARKLLLNNVWCSHCGETIGLKQYTVESAGQDIVLRGECPICHKGVARYVESE